MESDSGQCSRSRHVLGKVSLPLHRLTTGDRCCLQGRAHDAMQLLQAALSCTPQYAEAWNTLGVLQQDLGRVQVSAHCQHCMHISLVAPAKALGQQSSTADILLFAVSANTAAHDTR